MFKENTKAIYLQIADRVGDQILSDTLKPGDRLPSVREYAARLEVNPNTVVRTYEYLSNLGVIFNRRGIGFFLADNAREIISNLRISELLDGEFNEIFRRLQLLGVTADELYSKYQSFLNNNPLH